MGITARQSRLRNQYKYVDEYVGRRVRIRRVLLGMSQEKLGEVLGLTFQQVQKYERGSNRISASRLYQLSQILDAPIAYFFEDVPESQEKNKPTPPEPKNEDSSPSLTKRETLELVRAYQRISSARLRKLIMTFIKEISE